MKLLLGLSSPLLLVTLNVPPERGEAMTERVTECVTERVTECVTAALRNKLKVKLSRLS